MDGSHHAWLETRGPKLVLMGMVDDARNRFYGRFYAYEGVFPAMNVLEGYICRYGLPQSLYVDKHSTYKTVRHPSEDELLRGEEASTQFERATQELGIKIIHKTVRTILDGYLIRWKGKRFVIKEPSRRMLGRPATVMLHFDGRMIIRYEGRDLGYREIAEWPKRIPAAPVVRAKPPKYISPPTHPWKVYRDRFASELPERP